MKQTNKISIICPIHNRLKLTINGLKFLTAALSYYELNGNNNCQFFIVVVDDGSTDGSSEWILQNYPYITILRGDGNLWWSGAVNLAVDHSLENIKCDFLILWNDDLVPKTDYFVQLEKMLATQDLISTVYGSKIMSQSEQSSIWSLGGYFNKFSGVLGMYTQNKTNLEYFHCDWLPGMGTIIPASILVYKNLRWDSANFPQYHGDSDFTLRCKDLGIKIVVNTNLVLFNNTETSGIKDKTKLKDVYIGLTSLRSDYNLKRNFRFYTSHGIVPFVYIGMIRKYFYYIGGYIKHAIILRIFNIKKAV